MGSEMCIRDRYDVRNLWWIIDYNRQSLDGVVSDGLFKKIQDFFDNVGWNVVLLKYGKKLEKIFSLEGGDTLRQWINDCPNDLYSALTYKGQSGEKDAWRAPLKKDLKGVSGIKSCLLYTSPTPRDGLLSRMPSSA